jgi:hypothetical protein
MDPLPYEQAIQEPTIMQWAERDKDFRPKQLDMLRRVDEICHLYVPDEWESLSKSMIKSCFTRKEQEPEDESDINHLCRRLVDEMVMNYHPAYSTIRKWNRTFGTGKFARRLTPYRNAHRGIDAFLFGEGRDIDVRVSMTSDSNIECCKELNERLVDAELIGRGIWF